MYHSLPGYATHCVCHTRVLPVLSTTAVDLLLIHIFDKIIYLLRGNISLIINICTALLPFISCWIFQYLLKTSIWFWISVLTQHRGAKRRRCSSRAVIVANTSSNGSISWFKISTTLVFFKCVNIHFSNLISRLSKTNHKGIL